MLFDNIMEVSIDLDLRTISDMHSPVITLPSSFGTSSPTRNYGELQTTDWELSVDFRHQCSNGLNISAMATLSDFTEEFTKYENQTKGINSYYQGKKLGEIWGYETDRF